MSSLRARAAKGLSWVVGSLAGASLVNLLATLVLARLLVPEDFGVLAVPLLVLTYLESVGDLGTGAALVQRETEREGAALVSFGAALALSVPWMLGAWLGADAIAGFFGRPGVAPAIELLALTFPLKALGQTHDSLLQCELRFGRRTAAELTRAAVKAVVAISLALAGFGAWSLVWGQLAGTASWTISLWCLSPWRPWRGWHEAREQAEAAWRPLLGFGAQVVIVNVLSAVLHHLDKVLVGRVAGLTVLGLYTVAARLPEAAVTTLTWAVGRVAFPAFARAQADRDARRQVYVDALRLVSLSAAPAGVGLLVLAEPLVVVAFGEDWRSAAAPLRWLSLAAVFRALASHAGDLMKGVGRPELLRNLALLKACVVLPALFLAASRESATAIALALAAATLVNGLISTAVGARLLELRAGALLRAAAPGLAAAALMGLGVAALGRATSGWTALADVALRVPAGVALFALLAPALSPGLRGWIAKRLRRRAEARP